MALPYIRQYLVTMSHLAPVGNRLITDRPAQFHPDVSAQDSFVNLDDLQVRRGRPLEVVRRSRLEVVSGGTATALFQLRRSSIESALGLVQSTFKELAAIEERLPQYYKSCARPELEELAICEGNAKILYKRLVAGRDREEPAAQIDGAFRSLLHFTNARGGLALYALETPDPAKIYFSIRVDGS